MAARAGGGYVPRMFISFALFADAANISQEGKLNVLGVFDAVHVAALPSVHPRATLVLRFKGGASDVGRHVVTMQWCNPAGDELWSSAGEVDVGGAPAGADELDFPLIASIDLPLDSLGRYEMRVHVDGEVAAVVRLHVQAAAQSLVPSGAGALVS
jgi:hypothetical protein